MNKPWLRCSRLLKAIAEKDYATVNAILDTGFDIDTCLMFRKTGISICVLNGWFDMAKLFVDRGCSLSLKMSNGETPLHIAVMNSDYNLVKLLIENRADLTSIDLSSKTALHYACEMNNLKIATLLLENVTPAIVNMQDQEKRTPLMFACQKGYISLISSLLSKGAKLNVCDIYGNNCLLHAIGNENCSVDIVNMLLDAGADINHRNSSQETALLSAIRGCSYPNSKYSQNFMDVCLLLIERGSDVNAKNYLEETPLHMAVILQNETLVRRLLNFQCTVNDLNAIGHAPLHYACLKGCEKITSLLVDGGSVLHHYVDLESVRYLLLSGEVSHKEDYFSLLFKVLEKAKECPSLSNMCRTVIRQNLPKNIEKSSLLLPLPQFLIRFIQLM